MGNDLSIYSTIGGGAAGAVTGFFAGGPAGAAVGGISGALSGIGIGHGVTIGGRPAGVPQTDGPFKPPTAYNYVSYDKRF